MTQMLLTLKNIGLALKDAVLHFGDNKITKKSASLAYYTLFAVAPLIFLIISLAGIFWAKEILKGEVFDSISRVIGGSAAEVIQDLLSNTMLSGDSKMGSIISAVTLAILASGIFVEIQDSINEIWSIKTDVQNGVWSFVKSRLLSFSLIVSLGFLLLVTLLINSGLEIFFDRISLSLDEISVILTFVVNYLVLITIITFLFYLIYQVLPDASFRNKISITGAFITAVFFLIGKYLIGLYLSSTDFNTTYGKGGALVLLLSWVYYSAIILYFGASFTVYFAFRENEEVRSVSYSKFVKNECVEVSDHDMKNMKNEEIKNSENLDKIV